ncbi:MAG TPA: histidinol-phosphate transaminase [Steroidobacteraceae bacterium]|nr:histidinol-phosphate transaminase [Steroidobacteraceae bacterium]
MTSEPPTGERQSGERHPGRLAVAAVRALSPYLPGKPISELERELGIHDIVKLASNENPYGPSPHTLAAMRAALEDVWLYPDGGCHALKQGLAKHLGIDSACLTLGNGSNDLLVLLAEAFLTPSHSAVYSQYGFAIYALVTRQTGAQPIEVPALGSGSAMPLGHDLAAMAAAITPNTRLVFIANPNNPTGTWAPPMAIKALLERSAPSTLVVLDEAYFEYGHALGTQDGVPWLREHPNLVVLRTFSKAYGLAGARVGYAISHPEVAEVLNRLRPAFNVNALAQAGALAALADQGHMRAAVSRTMRELTRVDAQLKRLGLWTAPSAANFVLLRLDAPATPVFERLLARGLIVRPLAGYGLANCLRISIGLPSDNDRLLSTLPQAL